MKLKFSAVTMAAMMMAACGSGELDTQDEYSQGQLRLPSAVSSAAFVYQPSYTGLQGELTFTAEALPVWARLDPVSGAITGTPAQPQSGRVQIVASNGTDTLRYSGELRVEDAARYQGRNLRDFYATGYDQKPRRLRNDLSGDLAAEIQFVQTHSIAPAGNYRRNTQDETQSRYMPRLVAQRDALLLFLPQNGTVPESVTARLLQDGEVVDTLTLQHPNSLPAADFAGGAAVAYSSRAWWTVIPWQYVRNGLGLEFSDGERTGVLDAGDIDIGLATQIVFQTIRLGMLTQPPASSGGQFVSNDPVLAATDYFETLPVARLVMANYADTTLPEVMVRSGKMYTTVSDTNGDVYSGDMRGDVAKSQVSVGINLANFGYSSYHMNQSYSHAFKQITNHHARGVYQNGAINHGLSGGNGIGTLYASAGNEASHEWGHAYGMGHYPGQGLTSDGRWAVHHADSGWGYIGHRQRMRASLSGINSDGSYSYNKDAMSGGWDGSDLSRYTYYTGYTARLIQADLERFAVPDTGFAGGYKQWNTATGRFEAVSHNQPVPQQVGVAVATILGAHDPLTDQAVIYPVFHGNYGNVFSLPAPDLSGNSDQCWLDIRNAAGEQRQIQVAATRHAHNSANQLHVNLPASFRPTQARFSCRRQGTVTELARRDFDGEIPALPPVAIVGMEAGRKQLQQREWVEIAQELAAMTADEFTLPQTLQIKIDSYDRQQLLTALPEQSRIRLQAIYALQDAAESTRVLLNHARATGLSRTETAARLRQHLHSTGLLHSDTPTLAGGVIAGYNHFFDGRQGQGELVSLTPMTPDNAAVRTRWVRDAYNRLHPVDRPWLCLGLSSDRLRLFDCATGNAAQRFSDYNGRNNPWVLQSHSSGRCLDFNRSAVTLITYGCTGSGNQQW